MAKELSKDDMRRFARLGAMRRLEDIRQEEAAIRSAFPELFSGARPAPRGAKAAGGPAKTAKGRKRSNMSPAMRKVVSERMKKYWAGRRKAKNG
ncbi:MAG: hypothetical protein KA371_07135 [Acidobacteria bacterium]|nr:hypothetical protein [Acidobacteriota bacterium]